MRNSLALARSDWARASFIRKMDALNKRADAQLVALTLQGNRADALDVTQDALVRAYDALASFDSTRLFAPWLFTIVTRLALNHAQCQCPAVEWSDHFTASQQADPAPRALETEQQARVRAILIRNWVWG